MGTYRLTDGRYRRFEDGTLTEYKPGDLIELDAEESRRLARIIEPVGQTKAKAEGDQEAESGDTPDEALSAPEAADPPDPPQDTGEDVDASEDPGSADAGPPPAPTAPDPMEEAVGRPVFTPQETPNLSVVELKKVVANVGEPSVITDMIDAERSKGDAARSTVFTLLQARQRELEEEERRRERAAKPSKDEADDADEGDADEGDDEGEDEPEESDEE